MVFDDDLENYMHQLNQIAILNFINVQNEPRQIFQQKYPFIGKYLLTNYNYLFN